MTVDFGRTAADYGAYRAAYPAELFARLRSLGVGVKGQRIVDLGTGTGAFAREFARAGCTVTGVDLAGALLAEARRLDAAAAVEVEYVQAPAENTGLPSHGCDGVTAAQCWHWFDRPRASAETRRLLVPGGRLAICHLDYLPRAGNVCAASEALVLQFNPRWTMAGGTGMHPEWVGDVTQAGFRDIETFSFDVEIAFTHEAWRGRMRTCNGVGASLPDSLVAAFDEALARLLAERFPEQPLSVPHRASAVVARSGA